MPARHIAVADEENATLGVHCDNANAEAHTTAEEKPGVEEPNAPAVPPAQRRGRFTPLDACLASYETVAERPDACAAGETGAP